MAAVLVPDKFKVYRPMLTGAENVAAAPVPYLEQVQEALATSGIRAEPVA